MKDLNEWSRAEFDALPSRKWDDTSGEWSSIVILPTRQKHDSGYRAMAFALMGKDSGVLVGGYSDVMHIDGIGGLGDWDPKLGVPRAIPPKGWSIDCLRKSGLLRIFARGAITVGSSLSSFEIYAKER